MARRSVEEQERLGAAMQRLNIEMGVFVADADFQTTKYVDGGADNIAACRQIAQNAIPVAQRVNARWITVVPGNKAPQISGTPTLSVVEEQGYAFTPTASDPDGDSLVFSISGQLNKTGDAIDFRGNTELVIQEFRCSFNFSQDGTGA